MKKSPVLVLPLTLCLWASSARSQTATPVPTALPPKIDPKAAQRMVDRVLKETSALRHLSIKSPVKSGVKSVAAIETMVNGQMKDVTSGEIVGTELILKQLGLAKPGFQLKSYYVKMLGEQIAGYYDNETKTFYTVDHVDPLQLETIMAHELTHALQDQHFGLGRLKDMPRHESDAKLAMTALVEGDATFTMGRYMTSNPMRMLGILASTLKSQPSQKILDDGPKALKESLTFPYLKGMIFASNLYSDGGWTSISKAFSRPPQSTEQVLHFEKYLSHEAPVVVPLRDVTPILGKGWKLLDHDVNGELGLQETVAEHLGDDAMAVTAAEGWGGDRYEVYNGPHGGVLVVQDTVWDSEVDAQEWSQAYARSTNNRFPVKVQSRGALQVWNAAPNGVWMERRGKRVLILEGTVGAFNPTEILGKLWG